MSEITGLEDLPSPALLFDADEIERNLNHMLSLVANVPSRLRPHIKTHKCAEILKLQLDRGIKQIKCATIAEAELASIAGASDVLIAYPLVGTDVERFFKLKEAYPFTHFSCVVDSPEGIAFLEGQSKPVSVFLDLDCGMHRTGIVPGPEAIALVHQLRSSPSLDFAGIHFYDGHIHQSDLSERRHAFNLALELFNEFRRQLFEENIEVRTVISGGSPTYPFHAEQACRSQTSWQCSPGTPILWDGGYAHHFPDLPFQPAAYLLTRVVSHPEPDRICLDLGHKAVSAENPLSNRVRFPDLGEVRFLSQSEEHLVIDGAANSSPKIGDQLIGIPWHVCPTVALHERAFVIRSGSVTEEVWPISRDRILNV